MGRIVGLDVGVEKQGSGAGAEEQQLTVDFGRKQIPQVIHQPKQREGWVEKPGMASGQLTHLHTHSNTYIDTSVNQR